MSRLYNWAGLMDDIGAALTGARGYPESPARDRILELLVEARMIAWQEWEKNRNERRRREASE